MKKESSTEQIEAAKTGQQLEMIFDLSDELLKLRAEKKDLEDKAKETNKQINAVDWKICNLMQEAKAQNFTRGGQTFFLKNTKEVSCVAENKEDLFAALRDHGQGGLITETVPAQSLKAFVNELIDQNDDVMPEWLRGLVSTFDRTTCAIRKAPVK